MKLKELLEELAEIEHEQWLHWANAVKGEVSPERAKRWESYMVPYGELSEKAKDMDRVWAKRVLIACVSGLSQEKGKKGIGGRE